MVERTLIIIKPDGIQRHLAGEIISRFERKGFKLVAAKLMQIPEAVAREHYAIHKGKPFFKGVVEYLSSAPSLIMVWEAEGIIDMSRKLMGATFGYEAEAGTIRGDFSCSWQNVPVHFNLVHGSDSAETAAKEISLYFKPEEIVDYNFADASWLGGKKD
jgi:nucleoside-diphosphate kinase